MKQQIQLHIPEPCHENWDAMTGTQQGRFCMSCQKEVVDFSAMTDKEILNYISKASSSMCGRVNDDQLHRVIQSPAEKRHYSFKYFWSVLITSLLLYNKSSAQIKSPTATNVVSNVDRSIKGDTVITVGAIATVDHDKQPAWQINGRVVDENNNPVSYASVIIKGTSNGVATDTAGAFSLKVKSDKVELVVSSVGFTTQVLQFDKADQVKSVRVEDKTIKITMTDISLQKAMMGEVVVASNCSRKGKMTTGLMSTITRYTVLDSIKNLLPGNEIKVYPNPISVNRIFKIAFNLKNHGEYALRFTDASGKLLATQPLNIIAKNQLENFNANIFRTGGVYFVSVTSKQSRKIYTSKLIVQ